MHRIDFVLSGQIWWTIPLLAIAAEIVAFWPFRRVRQFVLSRVIAAPRERIWRSYVPDVDEPHYSRLEPSVSAVRSVRGQADMVDLLPTASASWRVMRFQILADQRPAAYARRLCHFDKDPFPFGPDHAETLELTVDPEGTLATYTWRGETATLWQFFRLWWGFHKYLRRFADYCESDCVVTESRESRSLWTGLALSFAAIGSFVLMFGWLFGVVLAAILVVHELGHWVAMRITGQPAPRMMLIPFFGGLAVANHPHKTLFDDAFSALMGAGLSVVPSLLFLLVAVQIGDGDLAEGLKALFNDGVLSADSVAAGAAVLALLTGLVNFFQLLPVLPLDGGQILRTVVQSIVGGWAGRILLGATVGGAAAFAMIGDLLVAGILGAGALQAWHLGNRPPEAAPMSGLGLLVIGAGYGLTMTAHLTAFVYGATWIGLDLPGLIAGYASIGL